MSLKRYSVARRRMVADLEAKALVRSSAVKEAMLAVPRDCFATAGFEAQAYLDDALPIGEGQTISKPSTVATMMEALRADGERTLEIGTGSGYATAVLAQVAAEVFSIERHRALSLRARRIFQSLGYRNISCRTGDGGVGWPEAAPFGRILVTAGADAMPASLLAQLDIGGRMVVPVGNRLLAVTRLLNGEFEEEDLGRARFVPFVTGVR